MVACPACGQGNADGARFCQRCGRPISATPAHQDVRKTVTVLFADVTGFTGISERLDPESMKSLMTSYFSSVRTVLERHGGTVEKFIGDAVMAIFGVPVLHEDDALRAVRAAAEMRDRLAELNEELSRRFGVELRIRTGVNTGEVAVGRLVGGEPFVTGDAVNVAARLEQMAEPGQILLGPDTHHLVEDAVESEPVAPLEVKGREQLVQAHRLVAVRDEPTGHRRRLRSPMVGRAAELARLREGFASARMKEGPQLVSVLGPAGVGKSRLVQEFLDGLGGEVTSLTGRCLPYGEGITFWPVGEMVRAACGLEPGTPADEARARIAARLPDDEHADAVAAGVAQLIGLAGASGSPEETFWGCRRFLEALAGERPLVCVFDDLHWAEPGLLDLVEYLADFADGPILLVCLARLELLESRPGWGATTADAAAIPLDPLSGPETGELIANLLGGGPGPALRDRVAEASEGNPLFVEEMLRMFIDEGAIHEERGTWVAGGDVARLPTTPTISALLSARLEQIAPEERAVAQCAAVVGKVFYWGTVAALVPDHIRPDVGAHLRSLIHKELITPDQSSFGGQDAFRFRHLLIQEAAYRSIPKRERAELHERVADWIEQRVGAPGSDLEEIVAHHLEQAHRYRTELASPDDRTIAVAVRAAERLATSGARALGRGDVPASLSLLLRAAALLPEDHPRRPSLLADLGQAHMERGELARAHAVLAEAVERAVAADDRTAEARARLAILGLRLYTDPEGKTGAVVEEVQRVIPVFEEVGDERGMATASLLLAEADWFRCRYAAVEEHLGRTIAHAKLAGDRAMEMQALARMASAVLFGPTPAEVGIRRCRDISEQARGQPRVEASVLCTEAELRAMLGRFEGTREQIGRARELLEDLGQTFRSTTPSEALAFVEMLADDPVAAERELRWGYRVLEEMGERGFLSTAAAELAQAVYLQGRLDEAEAFATESIEASSSDDLASRVPATSILARVRADRGDLDGAERLAREAVEQADRTDNLVLQGDALMDLAEVLATAGRPGDAVEALTEAATRFEQKGNVVSARKASRARDRLAPTG